jgi:hypothetical protein
MLQITYWSPFLTYFCPLRHRAILIKITVQYTLKRKLVYLFIIDAANDPAHRLFKLSTYF